MISRLAIFELVLVVDFALACGAFSHNPGVVWSRVFTPSAVDHLLLTLFDSFASCLAVPVFHCDVLPRLALSPAKLGSGDEVLPTACGHLIVLHVVCAEGFESKARIAKYHHFIPTNTQKG